MALPDPSHPPALTLGRAASLGLDRNRLRTNWFRHLYRGLYLNAERGDELAARCAALALVLPPDARFSHQTAATLYGAPLTASVDEIHVSVPAGVVVPRRRPGVVTHQRILDSEPVLVAGLPISCPEQTFLDLAAVTSRRELVVLGDHIVGTWTTPEALAAYLAGRPRTRGIVRAREAASLVRPGVDSPQESRLRLAIVDAGLPEPEVNRAVYDDAGEWVGTPDLGYFEQRVAIQHEGEVHWTNVRRWRQDVARDESFRDIGWIVLRTVSDDVARPARFLHRLARRLTERGWRPSAA